MDIYSQIGKIALGSRLRRLGERIADEAFNIYKLYDIDLQPKWFPVFYALSLGQKKTISMLAAEIGHSQPSVSKIVREMTKKGIVLENKDASDKRKNFVSLTKTGIAMNAKIQDQYKDVNIAIEEALAETNNDLWKAIEEWEFLLNQKSLLSRVKDQQRIRESADIEIVDYETKYNQVFVDLNVEWISTYFKMEDADYKALNNPEEYILKKGGHIFVALYKGEPLGVCALMKLIDNKYEYELAKIAVSPKAQGKNLGWLLGQTIINKAKSLGASKLYLESNTILKPAISLYQKLGFEKVVGLTSPYERCNIQMELKLK
ncbi:MarR family transcriptional regulator [Chryseobacterium sp. Leaf405]|uniref:bifunctional helix-turn-helix transcriptional regulator/GNAT family N-acetyltransferase n=1 Tax=Chryseobacterium sp. Leaf405 TaxID=1736367 RepID=UPI0006F8FAD5|nr:bifunctional helix-turn-helix transcriptional regulator/GNAT family N-acetyltransferase [Chryseobacterium sp. Leaf405]KQT27625.1 MarR family transcriptional regulator [Chryseobacterium sp. Leaf405]